MSAPTPTEAAPQPGTTIEAFTLGTLLHLARRLRHAPDEASLGFIAVNETFALANYRQAALWFGDRGVAALSSVVSPEANAPYVQWLEKVARHLSSQQSDAETQAPEAVAAPQPTAREIVPADLAAEDAQEWDEWLPARLLVLPLPETDGLLLLARETAWQTSEQALLAEWADIVAAEWRRLHRPSRRSDLLSFFDSVSAGLPKFRNLRRVLRAPLRKRSWQLLIGSQIRRLRSLPWHIIRHPRQWLPACKNGLTRTWREPGRRYFALMLIVLFFPVRLSILAPGELVPVDPAVIRAPLDGTVDQFFVSPNARVAAGDKLFQLNLTALQSKLEVAQQGLVTAEAEYRQAAQQAVFDDKSKVQLALLQGRIGEKQAEAGYLKAQLERAQVVAPIGGIALLDDPTEWIGRPVATGERIMTVAEENRGEVEAWLSLADVLDFPEDAEVTLYLNSTPLSPVRATLRYLSHEAVLRPDGSYAYRLRATLAEDEVRRVGQKGTAKVAGRWSVLSYMILRRPLAALRQFVGF